MNEGIVAHRAVVDYASSFLPSPAACVAERSFGWAQRRTNRGPEQAAKWSKIGDIDLTVE
jgi:hypothetical protein